jgi:hypothetical protein
MEQPVSCAAMRNGVIFRLITTSPTNNHSGFAADDLRSPRRPVEKGPCPTSDHPSLRVSRSVGLHGSGFSDRTRFASAPAARTASMVAHNDQVKGGRIPGFPHPVEPAGGTRRHGWGYREPRSSSGYTATVPTPVRKRRGRPCSRSQPVGHESFGHEQSFCPAALSMPPLDGESVARRTADAITPRGAKNPLHPGLGPANRKLTAVCMATVRDPSRSGPSTRLTGGLVPQEERASAGDPTPSHAGEASLVHFSPRDVTWRGQQGSRETRFRQAGRTSFSATGM